MLDDLDDEDIGFALVDAKKDSAIAKKLGKLERDITGQTINSFNLLLSQCLRVSQ